MAEIVNLRRARKAKARAEAQATAAENRIQFGRTAQEKKQSAAQKALEAKRLDGHRRDDDDQG
ncbi:DUF4169 family protein [Oleomonas cavernae]|uniref:DUF4169 family protein n=1 Tax=Oleomonas cavernae TaxID=2320859 RepID=A0A418WE02_9PROT|nr:DUF4169 family protein [Oleomonas cavernae]RJF88179.1 DUF4169 family protein [Oleomonas cavernae]